MSLADTGESLVVSRQLSVAQSCCDEEVERKARKLYKATYQRSAPSTNASIPSKYRTYFTPNIENKGFNSHTMRFLPCPGSHTCDDNPGPGFYSVHHQSSLTAPEVSLSKRGTGGFASKARRFRSTKSAERLSGKVGPGSYNPVLHSHKLDFNRKQASRNFQSSVLIDPDSNNNGDTSCSKDTGPAPNSYQINQPIKLRLPGGEAPFKSKTKRGWTTFGQHTPGPGQYNPSCHVTGAHTLGNKTANFQSKTKRTQPINNIGNPGPADYFKNSRSSTSSSLPYYKQKHYLCISAPAIPLPPLPPTPGPGHYELIQNDSEEQLVGGAVFKSTSSRWKGDSQKLIKPGPGTYNPKKTSKQSFLYNWNQQWI